jgi:phosphatidylinositol 4-kinase
MNKRLPADVYLPFRSLRVQGMKVASIVVEECKVFPTKLRAPFYVCLEVYEERLTVGSNMFSRRIVSTTNINDSMLKKSHLFEQDTAE